MKYYTFEDNTIILSIINKTVVSLNTRCSILNSAIFYDCSNLTYILLSQCKTIELIAFGYCSALSEITLPVCNSIKATAFLSCTSLERINLLNTSVCLLENSNAFSGTPILDSSYLGYYGSIYVPSALVETYKAAENWSYYADRITAYVP